MIKRPTKHVRKCNVFAISGDILCNTFENDAFAFNHIYYGLHYTFYWFVQISKFFFMELDGPHCHY